MTDYNVEPFTHFTRLKRLADQPGIEDNPVVARAKAYLFDPNNLFGVNEDDAILTAVQILDKSVSLIYFIKSSEEYVYVDVDWDDPRSDSDTLPGELND